MLRTQGVINAGLRSNKPVIENLGDSCSVPNVERRYTIHMEWYTDRCVTGTTKLLPISVSYSQHQQVPGT